VLVSNGYLQWQKTITETHECRKDKGFPYMKVYIDAQELREPIFDGRYFINLGKDADTTEMFRTVSQLTVIQSEMTADGSRQTFIFKPTLYNYQENRMTRPDQREVTNFTSRSRSHYMFPFDSASFDAIFSFEPSIALKSIVFSNHVAGFYIPCDTITVHEDAASTKISFELRRNPLITGVAVLLVVAAGVFAILITLFMENAPLPHALSSFFFAV
jgi:hypothetical protein